MDEPEAAGLLRGCAVIIASIATGTGLAAIANALWGNLAALITFFAVYGTMTLAIARYTDWSNQ